MLKVSCAIFVSLLFVVTAHAQQTLGEQLIGSILLESNKEFSEHALEPEMKDFVMANIIVLTQNIDRSSNENIPVWLSDLKTLDHALIGNCIRLGANGIPWFPPEKSGLIGQDEYIQSVACVYPGQDMSKKLFADDMTKPHVGFVIGKNNAPPPVPGKENRILIWADYDGEAGYDVTQTLWQAL